MAGADLIRHEQHALRGSHKGLETQVEGGVRQAAAGGAGLGGAGVREGVVHGRVLVLPAHALMNCCQRSTGN